MAAPANRVFLIGEFPLVEECAGIFRTAGYNVLCRFNSAPEVGKLPRSVKNVASTPRTAKLALELSNIDIAAKRKNLSLCERSLPPSTLIFSSSVTISATEQASWLKHPNRLVGISALPSLFTQNLIELAPTIHTEPRIMSEANNVVTRLRKEVAVVQDRVGMVLPRIICMLINEASFSVMEGTASPGDIDTAMKLGTNYPFGPIEWAERIGIKNVVAVLEALHRDLNEERYRVSPLLRQLSLGRKWW